MKRTSTQSAMEIVHLSVRVGEVQVGTGMGGAHSSRDVRFQLFSGDRRKSSFGTGILNDFGEIPSRKGNFRVTGGLALNAEPFWRHSPLDTRVG